MTISAKIIADSIDEHGKRITTFELEYPRFIHSEFMTHRLFSRNAASSRAIPIDKAIRLILEDTASPSHWGKNQPGMSAKEENDEPIQLTKGTRYSISRLGAWNWARDRAVEAASAFADAKYHKQIINRLLEPFSHIKVVVTATEYDNFYWLRNHADAQPEIKILAEKMLEAVNASFPKLLRPGDWHVPYYKGGQWFASGYARGKELEEVDDKRGGNTLKEALAISASCCAQVSYRVLDDSLEKAQSIFQRLVEAKPVHASPFEHQATPMKVLYDETEGPVYTWEEGMTHMDRYNKGWSGNFQGWIQHRQLIEDNVCWRYNGHS
ncbi:thymidylate synthetase [Xanthomonas phage BUDD]|nr:thymidylate synthetase [Xanthomonas phage BUDD]